jgi:hypothetical protein
MDKYNIIYWWEIFEIFEIFFFQMIWEDTYHCIFDMYFFSYCRYIFYSGKRISSLFCTFFDDIFWCFKKWTRRYLFWWSKKSSETPVGCGYYIKTFRSISIFDKYLWNERLSPKYITDSISWWVCSKAIPYISLYFS